ncbi:MULTISPECIES: hypothetical protein [Paenibacillus]|uniref:Uncharacterized protein n=1 Tax=Paenibacillus albilobatus TaxID=2716884 RepID=A0A919XJ50_9BACL|nr:MULTISPECIES: hypothetical protein [Paenibacillus]GIO33872.1 hypothetical protein J2TS6_50130 [Paenibacillus albilobatus]
MKQVKPVKTRSIGGGVGGVGGVGGGGGMIPTRQRNEIALISAILFLIAAALSLFVAWNDLRSGGTSETLI